ncbi:MAG TPA: hydrogenase maturation protease [Terriglobales bacterium]|nr:hydrogenase maturation protease [Terriglobales bacterium]
MQFCQIKTAGAVLPKQNCRGSFAPDLLDRLIRVADYVPGEPQPRTQIVRGRTIVIGLGNPMLGDDGVGWRVADEVEGLLRTARNAGRSIPDVEVERLGVGGLRLMECLTGYEAAILVDAAEFRDRPIGEVCSCSLGELEDYAAGHLDSAHDASLRTALALGRRLGASLPNRIEAVTIQVQSTDIFCEELSPEVADAVPVAVSAVMSILMADM